MIKNIYYLYYLIRMNTLINIPNKVKQSSLCCMYCGKGYKIGTNLTKHILLCELLNKSIHKSKNQKIIIEEEEEIPSQKKLYHILLDLGKKYIELEEKYNNLEENLKNYNVKIHEKKINIIEWLNNNLKPEYVFEKLIDKIIIENSDIEVLLNNTFNNTLNAIFSRNLHNETEIKPIFAYIKKPNLFYIYDKINENEEKWIELSREKIIKFLNKIQQKISRKIVEWKNNHREEINTNDKFAIMYDKAIVKLMGVEFKHEFTLNKVVSLMYTQIKVNVVE